MRQTTASRTVIGVCMGAGGGAILGCTAAMPGLGCCRRPPGPVCWADISTTQQQKGMSTSDVEFCGAIRIGVPGTSAEDRTAPDGDVFVNRAQSCLPARGGRLRLGSVFHHGRRFAQLQNCSEVLWCKYICMARAMTPVQPCW